MNDKNLKPCPFCGNTEVIYIPLSNCSGYVFCTDCNMATKTYWDEMTVTGIKWHEYAASAWNRRCENAIGNKQK